MTTHYHLLTSAEYFRAIAAKSTCIAIIDESDNLGVAATQTLAFNQWATFRATWPIRPYFLIQVAGGAALNIPTNLKAEIINDITATPRRTRAFIYSEPNFAGYFVPANPDASVLPSGMPRDNSNVALQTDIFDICGLSSLQPGDNVFVYVDDSGSMSRANVRASLNLLRDRCATAGIRVTSVFDTAENYIAPFISFTGLAGIP